MNIFYIYVSARGHQEKLWKEGKGPNSLLYGLTELRKMGHQVAYSDIGFSNLKYFRIILWPIEKLISMLFGQGFNLFQVLILWPKFRNSDIIFAAGDNVGLALLLLKKLKLIKPPVIYLSIALFDKANIVLRPAIVQKLYRALFSQASNIIVFSKIEEEKFLKLGAKNVKFTPLGIDTDYFAPQKIKNENFVLSVGRDLDRDYKLLFDFCDQLPLKLVVVTSHRNLQGLTPPRSVEIKLDLAYEGLRDLYASAKMIILPLKQKERANGQLVLLEALAMNKVVVATDAPGIISGYENLRPFITLVPASDKNAFLKAVENQLKSQKFTSNGRQEVLKKYNSVALATAFERVFKAAI